MQVGITFDKQLLTSRQHAHFQSLFLNHTDGITKGCGVSQSDGNVYVQKGFFVVSGRFVEVTGVETIESPAVTSGTLYCKVVYEIDLSKTNTESNFAQGYFKTLTSASGYPSVTQDDLDGDGTLYQMPFCQYTKTVDAVGSFLDIRPIFNIESVWGVISANNSEYKSLFDAYFAAQKAEIEQMIADLQGEGYLLISDARRVDSITLAVDGWTGSEAPYEQVVALNGMKEEDVPDLGIIYPSGCTRAQQKAINKAAGYIYEIETGDGTVTVRCTQKPITEFTLGLKGVVRNGAYTG